MRVIYLSMLLLLGGCAIGTKFTWDQVRQVKAGMTMPEVEKIMGPPYQITSGPGVEPELGQVKPNQTVATWTFVQGFGTSQSVHLIFGPDGRLISAPGDAVPHGAASAGGSPS